MFFYPGACNGLGGCFLAGLSRFGNRIFKGIMFPWFPFQDRLREVIFPAPSFRGYLPEGIPEGAIGSVFQGGSIEVRFP